MATGQRGEAPSAAGSAQKKRQPKVDAVVLAGARNEGRLRAVASEEYEAEIPVGGMAMFLWVVNALKGCAAIDRVVVVGPQSIHTQARSHGAEFVVGGQTVIDNIKKGIDYLGSGREVLLVTSDVPLLTSEAVADFLENCRRGSAEMYYPIVPRHVNENQYPGVRRTYFRLREGVFTGGNMILLRPDVVERCGPLMERVVQLRKKPWKMSRLLGVRFIIKFLLHALSISEIEQRTTELMGLHGKGIVCNYPEVGIDVDKPEDLYLVRSILEGDQCAGAAE